MAEDIKDSILYVDDEVENLDIFQLSFERYYKIFLANTAEKGFEILKEEKIKVVLADQRMPNTSGIDFLKQLSKIYPSVIRIIVTAYADTETIINAINTGMVYRFITKPWNKNELKISIDNGIESYILKIENQQLIKELQHTNLALQNVNVELKSKNNELARAINQIHSSEKRFRTLADLGNIGIWQVDPDRNTTYINPAMCHILDIETIEEIKNKNQHDFFLEKGLNKLFPQNQLKIPIIENTEYQLISNKNNIKTVIVSEAPLFTDKGKLSGMIASYTDVSHLKNVEDALREKEEKYRLLIEGQSDLVVKINTDNKMVFVSPSYCDVFGKTEEQLLNQHFIFSIDKDDQKNTLQALESLKTPPYTSYIEHRAMTKNGWRWIAWSNKAVLDYNNNITEIIGVGRDVTENKASEKDLEQYTAELKSLNNLMHHISTKITVDDVINTSLNELLASTNADMVLFFLREDNDLILINSKSKKKQYTHGQTPLHKVGECLCGQAAATGSSIFSDNILKDVRCSWQECKNAGIKSFAALPLNSNNKILGVIGLATFEKITKYSQRNQYLETIGKEITISLQNALLYDEVKLQHKELVKANIDLVDEINERQKMQDALKESEEKFRLLFESANDAIIMLKGYKCIHCNEASSRIFKRKRNNIINHNIFEFSPEKQPDNKISKNKMAEKLKLAKEGVSQFFEWQFCYPNQQLFDVEISLNKIDVSGTINFQAVIRDITFRKRSELEILRTNNYLQGIINASPDVIYVRDIVDDKFVYISKKVEQVTLYSVEECLIAKNVTQMLVYKDDIKIINEHIKRLYKLVDPEVIETEFRLERKDKKIIWVRTSSTIFLRDKNGKAIQTLVVLKEITDRKIALQKLQESEEKFKNIFNNSSDGILITNENNAILEVNKAFCEKIGVHRKDILNSNYLHNIPDEFKENIDLMLLQLFNEKKALPIEIELVDKNNKLIPVELNSKLIDYEGKKAILTLARDIAERKQMQRNILDAIISTEEKEREKFAKNLHDDLGPLLSSIRMYMNSFTDTKDTKKQDYIIEQVNEILKEAIQSTKEISNDLSPHILTNYGLISAIESFAKKFGEHIEIRIINNIDNFRFENSIETSLYRISKEFINNTLKHARATEIKISYLYKNHILKLTYTDNGTGFNYKEIINNKKSGMGIFNIQNRVNTMNGKLKCNKQLKGVKYEIEVPVDLNPE